MPSDSKNRFSSSISTVSNIYSNIVSEAYELKKGDTAGRITMIMEQHSEEFRQAFIPFC